MKVFLLFSESDYIHQDLFNRCILTKNGISFDEISRDKLIKDYKECFISLDAQSLITTKKEIAESEGFNCQKFYSKLTSRNPFNYKDKSFFICKLKKKN